MQQVYGATDELPDANKSYLVLWIDALCINQRDLAPLAERSRQVRRIKDVDTLRTSGCD